jgi:hypothetical protein
MCYQVEMMILYTNTSKCFYVVIYMRGPGGVGPAAVGPDAAG